MALQIGDTAPDFEAETTKADPLSRWLGLLGRAVLAPEGLHAGLHDRTRLHGSDQAGVRPPQCQDHRASASIPWTTTQGGRMTSGRPRDAPNYPMIGDTDLSISKLGGCCRRALPASLEAHASRQPDRPERVRDRAGQEDQADPGLPDDHRPELRRGPAGHRLPPANGETQGGDARELEEGRGRDHRRIGVG